MKVKLEMTMIILACIASMCFCLGMMPIVAYGLTWPAFFEQLLPISLGCFLGALGSFICTTKWVRRFICRILLVGRSV